MNSRKRKGAVTDFMMRLSRRLASELQLTPPKAANYMTHDEIMESLFVSDSLQTRCALFKRNPDDPEGEFRYAAEVAQLLFINQKYRRLILAAPTLYKQLSELRDNMRRLEEYGHETANPVVEEYAAKQAEGANAAMMVATLGIDATSRILQHAQDCNEL